MGLNGRSNDHVIPDIVIRRLPIYARALRLIAEEGSESVSSDELADRVGVTAAQIRRDLSFFGRFGTQGKGYDVSMLIRAVEHILHLDRQWDVALVGFGHLGRAVADYHGFARSPFRVALIFDSDPGVIGQSSEFGVKVEPADVLVERVRDQRVQIGIVAVPASAAQDVTDRLVQAGVRAILNYAPVTLIVPAGIWVREIEPISAMQSMTYYLGEHHDSQDYYLTPSPERTPPE